MRIWNKRMLTHETLLCSISVAVFSAKNTGCLKSTLCFLLIWNARPARYYWKEPQRLLAKNTMWKIWHVTSFPFLLIKVVLYWNKSNRRGITIDGSVYKLLTFPFDSLPFVVKELLNCWERAKEEFRWYESLRETENRLKNWRQQRKVQGSRRFHSTILV